MTREEKLKLLLDTGEYDFIKSIPKENMWKLIFVLAYIEDTIPMSDVDGIKAEIRTEISDYEGCADFYEGIRLGLRTALEIIDKHIQPKKIVGKLISVEVLDKIRAEILEEKDFAYADFEQYKIDYLGVDAEYVEDELPQDDFRYGMERALEIIDKYKAEGSEAEGGTQHDD